MTRKTRSSTQKGANETSRVKKESNLKQERSLRACTRCRQRKQRCDNALPHCSNCIKGGVTCEAFPVNVGSREELMQLHNQLQESSRCIDAMQEELDLARLVVPDQLGLFSALVSKKLSDAYQYKDTSRHSDQESPTTTNVVHMSISDLQMSPGALPMMADVKPKISTPSVSNSKNKTQRACEKLDLWKAVELLEACFPAVAPAITFAVEQLDPKAASGRWFNLVDIASRPLRELITLLDSTAPSDSEANYTSYVADMRVSLKETVSQLFEASDMTRVAGTMLWALLAVVKNRPAELVCLDNVLTHFMQTWEKGAATDPAALLGVIPISFRRAYDWMHLRTAIMTGRLHIQLTSTTSFEGIEAIASKHDFQTFLAACHVEQKRLEYTAIHLFTIPAGTITDAHHQDAVWKLLCDLKQLAEVLAQSFDSFVTSVNVATNTRQALMRQKLGVQLYGLFPRVLYKLCPNDRGHSQWLINATHLASTALSYHRSALVQSGWLGDHVHDAVTFVDLLNAFAWLMQIPRTPDDPRSGWSHSVQSAIEVGELFVSKWPQYSTNLRAAINQLRNLRDEPPAASGLSTPWQAVPSHTTSSSPDPTSGLRTPHAGESINPYTSSLAPPLEWQPESQSQMYSNGSCSLNSSVAAAVGTSLNSTANGGEEGIGMSMPQGGVYTRNDGTHIFGTTSQNLQHWACSPQLISVAPLQQRATAANLPLQPSYSNVTTTKNETSNTNTNTGTVLFYMDDRGHSKD